MTGSTALNAARRARRAGPRSPTASRSTFRHRRRHHRDRHRPRRRDPWAVGRAGGEARPRLRHQPMELQAGARRPALSGHRQRRHRPSQRRRTRNPDDPQRASSGEGDAAAGAAAAVDGPWRAPWSASASSRRRPARARGHPASTLPGSRVFGPTGDRVGADGSRTGLDGALLAYDGQLIDDARLVTAVARTAAQHGARILTCRRLGRDRHLGAADRSADRRVAGRVGARGDQRRGGLGGRGRPLDPSCGPVAAPIWSSTPGLRQSDCRADVPIPGELNRFVFAMPEQLGRVYLGLTDEDAPGPIPDVPQPTRGRSRSCSTPSTPRWTSRSDTTTSSAPTPGCGR